MAINFQLLRSSTASKRPTAANLAVGELGLNFSDATGGLFYENASGGIVKVGPAEVGTAAPNSTPGGSTGNSLGELWYDTGNTELKVYTGSGFVSAGGGVAGITSAADAEAIDIDSSENVTFRQNVEFEGDLTISGQHDISMDDNTANVIDFKQASNSYLAFNTTDGSENITISKNLVLGGDDLTATAALDVKVIDNSGLALRVMEGTNEYLRVVTTDGSESVTIKKTLETDGDLQIDGGVTMPVATDIGIVDNSGLALRVMEGTNEYIRFTTTDGGEKIQTAKELEVNGALNIDGAVDCSGQVTFSGAQTITIPDNLGFGLRVLSADNAEFVRFTTTDGAELVDFSKTVKLDGGMTLAGDIDVPASQDITMVTGNSNAIDFTISGGNRMMRFNTNTETVLMEQNASVGGTFTFDSVALTAIQTSGETFADNDTSLMTSAAIDDRINNAAGITQDSGTTTLTFNGFSSNPDPKLTVTAYWVKTGKQVTLTFETSQNFGSYSGSATVTGLAHTANSNTDFFGTVHHNGSLATSFNDGMVCRIRGAAGTTIDFLGQESSVQAGWSGTNSTKDLGVTITYFTA